MYIYGKIAVLEALRSDKTFNKLLIDKSSHDKTLQEIINLSRDNGVKIDFVSRDAIERKAQGIKVGNQKINHQGVIGETVEFSYCEIEDIFEKAKNVGDDPFILVLDGIEDTHNLGALVRSAECAGVSGIIIPERRACAINETVIKTSAGAISNVLISRVNNLNQVIDRLKKDGVWVYAVEVGGENLFESNLKGPIALVLGSEGSGVSRLVKENCDGIVTIPMFGSINSLNVSVAGGISMFEVIRQRKSKNFRQKER